MKHIIYGYIMLVLPIFKMVAIRTYYLSNILIFWHSETQFWFKK